MRSLVAVVLFTALLGGVALGQASSTAGSEKTLAALPDNGVTVTDFYKQDVYDPSDNKIGTVEDVIIDNSGQVKALIIAVGGFLGLGEKDVASPFHAIQLTQKDNKWR